MFSMVEKFIELNLEDERAGKVAEVLGNKTAKKILGLIAENEMSENDISLKLKIPLNTIDYNIKKLLESGLVEESKSFFWSIKGKKIKTFRAANKKIIISTKPGLGRILPFVIISGAVGFAANVFRNIFGYSRNFYSSNFINTLGDASTEKMASGGLDSANLAAAQVESGNLITNNNLINFSSMFYNAWIWVVCGVLVGVGIYFLYKKLKGGKL